MADAGSIGVNVSANALSPITARVGNESSYIRGYSVFGTKYANQSAYIRGYSVFGTKYANQSAYIRGYSVLSSYTAKSKLFYILDGRYLPSYHVRKRGQLLTCIGATDVTDLINRKKDADLVPGISKRITMMAM